jgi:hypothetical protein
MNHKSSYQFDLIDAATFGYSAVWAERLYLLKLALVPIIIKFTSMMIILTQGFEKDVLTQGLILIPATLTEGWLLAQFLRTLIKQERWPIMLDTEPDQKTLSALLLRARGIVACCLVYVLLMLFTYTFKYGYELLVANNVIPNGADDTTPPDIRMMIIAVMGLGFALWSFRLFWIYIPFSVLVKPLEYLKFLGGFGASFKMLGLFLICMVPTLVVTTIVSSLVLAPFQSDDLKPIGTFLIILLGTAAEILVALIVTAGMAWSFRDLLPRAQGALPDIKRETN